MWNVISRSTYTQQSVRGKMKESEDGNMEKIRGRKGGKRREGASDGAKSGLT